MKVLVTGAAGFLGSHVCEYYRNKGWDVLGIDNLTHHELSRADYHGPAARAYMVHELQDMDAYFVHGDICYLPLLVDMGKGCDYIVHCAAQPTITASNDWLDTQVNIVGTLNVLGVALNEHIPLLNCSTIHVYGNGCNERLTMNMKGDRLTHSPSSFDESHPLLTGNNIRPLHVTKLAAEHFCDVYARRDGLEVATFRLTGMYGPRQFGGPDHGWMANMAIQAVMGRPITVFSPEEQVRDPIYATDVCRAIDLWFESSPRQSGPYNIGGGDSRRLSIKQYLTMLEGLVGRHLDVTIAPGRAFDLHYWSTDFAKAQYAFGWTPEIGLKWGVSQLVEWIKQHADMFEAKDGEDTT